MAIFKCKMCGGSLEIAEGTTVCECEYCGTQQTLPRTDNEQTLNMFNRANHFRQQCEFDKAAEIYERMTAQSDDAELYWSIVLCRYGIEYVDDPLTHKKIATCHRTQFKSILEDADFLEALAHADSAQREVYEREAAYIDKVQKGILEISNKEKPFDVFICYKESDENGRRTQDSVLAQELYYQLEREGFKVFFSRITLESKLGTEYEPYIFAALNSAKVMVVVGTKPEYFNAVWVRNEWSRYLMLMQHDRSRTLIPAYKDMDPYDLPDALSMFQAQDMSKLGFMQDLIRGISKIARADEPKPAAALVQTVVQKSNGNIENLLKRGFLSLEDQKWDEANRFFENVLNENVEEPRAYIGKLCAEYNVTSEKELLTLQMDYSSSDNYRKACRFGGAEVETRLHGYILQGIYNLATEMMENANTFEKCNIAKELLKKINGYADSVELIERCEEKAQKIKEEQRKENTYKDADVDINTASKNRLSYAVEVFEKIRGYRDVDEKIAKCEARIKELEEQEKAEKEIAKKKAKHNKLITIIVFLMIILCITGYIIIKYVFIPKSQYNRADKVLEAKDYDDNISDYESINKYDDSLDDKPEINYTAYNGKRIGILNDTIFEELTYEYFPDSEYFYFDSYDNLATALSRGTIDAFFGYEPMVKYIMMNDSTVDYLFNRKYDCNYSFVFSKNDRGVNLCDEFNEYIKKIKADGTLSEIDSIWLGTDESKKTPPDFSLLSGEKGNLRFATDSTNPPLVYINETQIVGYDIDIVYRFCKEYDYSLSISDTSFDGIISGVKNHKYDIGAAAIAKNEEKAQNVIFSEPYYIGDSVLAVRVLDIDAASDATP